jgi:hypothetical protein
MRWTDDASDCKRQLLRIASSRARMWRDSLSYVRGQNLLSKSIKSEGEGESEGEGG